jgi:Zn-dependent protease
MLLCRIVSFFVKPFFLFCIAGTICNFGVAIFGMLPVVNLDDGDEGTVANKKEARTVV